MDSTGALALQTNATGIGLLIHEDHFLPMIGRGKRRRVSARTSTNNNDFCVFGHEISFAKLRDQFD
jgi:hypothetical protein